MLHARSKHVELQLHFVGERVDVGKLQVNHGPGGEQVADILTKSLSEGLFCYLRDKLKVTTAEIAPSKAL